MKHNILNLRDAARGVLRGTLIAVNAYIIGEEKSQVSNLTFHIKTLEGVKKATETRTSKKKEIMKIRVKINKIKNRINNTKMSVKQKVGSLKRSTKL